MARYIFRRGSALVTCTLVLVIASVMAVSLAAISGANLEVAVKQREGAQAFASSESGLEVMRYWLSRVRVSSLTLPSQYLSTIITLVQSDLAAHNISNFQVNADGSIPAVTLSTVTHQDFRGQWSADASDPTIIHVTASGTSGQAARTITVQYNITPYHFPIFDYGIATKGPLVLKYNPKIYAASQGWEADIYIDANDAPLALDVGKSATLAGDLNIGDPSATVSVGTTLNMGGTINYIPEDDQPEFPVPRVGDFRVYATGPVLNKTSNLGLSSYTNAVIAAGTDPNFTAANVNIRGILYIEAPNKVTFGKITTLEGMIVAAGDVSNPGTNVINFGEPLPSSSPGNFTSGPYPAGAEFDALRQQQGACILAPGFKVSFNKNFTAVDGVIAASGLYFANNAVSTVKGTLINYSNDPLIVERNITLTFDRTGQVEIPAGFDLYRVLQYNAASYAMMY
ncbi:MAG: hypothetical protein M1376_08560 [Planctomycetes bacterium]|nr:hypothetical protein [Planctomycetota bacterium]